MAEGVLTFLITFTVLWIMIKGLRSLIIKTLILVVATVAELQAPQFNFLCGVEDNYRRHYWGQQLPHVVQWIRVGWISMIDDNLLTSME
ncbi:Aquaporin SIP1-1 [Platanthera guangdongensis]|uniref:Aquaporin SIP1-1 n=1 Tax=Platanthera guangdongensis TaxID=2320717 RepID=A0ABR2LMT4_9ASPA